MQNVHLAQLQDCIVVMVPSHMRDGTPEEMQHMRTASSLGYTVLTEEYMDTTLDAYMYVLKKPEDCSGL